jgi:DNA-binding response OmpR family regulator
MKILLVEDEPALSKNIQQYLSGNNIICEIVSTAHEALNKISIYEYDCILLDLSLPDGNGFEILKELKNQNKEDGVIIISAKSSLETKIEGLTLGADDFLIKPFHLAELLVRIQALIRRKQFGGNNILVFNEIKINLLSKAVTVNENNIELTKTELDLLLFLIGNKNRVLSKGTIAEHLSGDMADMLDNHDFVYAHIKNLKKKLKNSGCKDYIKTIYGLGYKFQG